MPNRTNTQVQVGQFFLRQAFRSQDALRPIYDWYKDSFKLIPAGETNEGCLHLLKQEHTLIFQLHTNVIICPTPVGRFIQVSRAMRVR